MSSKKMKKLLGLVLIVAFLLACRTGTATQVPAPTATSLPTHAPTIGANTVVAVINTQLAAETPVVTATPVDFGSLFVDGQEVNFGTFTFTCTGKHDLANELHNDVPENSLYSYAMFFNTIWMSMPKPFLIASYANSGNQSQQKGPDFQNPLKAAVMFDTCKIYSVGNHGVWGLTISPSFIYPVDPRAEKVSIFGTNMNPMGVMMTTWNNDPEGAVAPRP